MPSSNSSNDIPFATPDTDASSPPDPSPPLPIPPPASSAAATGLENILGDDEAPATPAQISAAYGEMYAVIKDANAHAAERDDDEPIPPAQLAAAYEDIGITLKESVQQNRGDDAPLPPFQIAAGIAEELEDGETGAMKRAAAISTGVHDDSLRTSVANPPAEMQGEVIPALSPPTNHPGQVGDIEGESGEFVNTWLGDGAIENITELNAEEKDNSEIEVDHRDSSASVPILEAWPAPIGDQNGRENGVVVVAELMHPWWKRQQNRLYVWVMLCFLSTIALATYTTNPDLEESKQRLANPHPYTQRWDIFITACAAISLFFSAVATLAHIAVDDVLSRCFVGTVMEGFTSFIIGVMWGCSLFITTDPNNNLGTTWIGMGTGQGYKQTILDANLYYSSWGATICAIILFAMYLGEQRNKILKFFKCSLRTGQGMGLGYTLKWVLLGLASFNTINESNWFRLIICEHEEIKVDATCARNSFGLITGSIGGVCSFVMFLLSYTRRDTALNTSISGLAMAVNYIICAAALCFGYGPATTTGNQYYSAWSGVFLSLSLFGGALKEQLLTRRGGDDCSDSAA